MEKGESTQKVPGGGGEVGSRSVGGGRAGRRGRGERVDGGRLVGGGMCFR